MGEKRRYDFSSAGLTTFCFQTTQYSQSQLIISTGANWVSGRYGSALEFVDTDIVSDISSSFDDSIDNAFTITSWVFWYGPNSGTSSSYIFDARGGSTSGFILMIDRDGNVTFSVLKSGSAQQITSESTISINTWTHIAAVFDYESKTISLFINGEEDIVTTATAPYYPTAQCLCRQSQERS